MTSIPPASAGRKKKREPFLRIGAGRYATKDGRFFVDRIGNYTTGSNWLVLDAARPKSVEHTTCSLEEARQWIVDRRAIRRGRP